MEETYKKNKGNVGRKGVQFQMDLIAVCLLNALYNHKNWKISSENPLAEKYDDIVVELAGDTAVLIQAKHKENKKITKDQLLSANSKNADFSLPKYFFSYEKIKSKFPASTVIICTNTGINIKGLEDTLTHHRPQPDSVLYHERDCSFYSFNEKFWPDLKKSGEAYLANNPRDKTIDQTMITQENLKDFLRNLQFFSCYPCEDHMHQIIEQSLSRLSYASLCRDISSQEILRKVVDWFQQPKGEYLTEARAKAMLCEIRSDKYCESLKTFNLSFGSNDLDIASWEGIIHIRVKEGHLLQMLKIYCALQGDKSKKLYVNPDDVEAQKHAVEAFGLRRYKYLIIAWAAIQDETAKREIINTVRRILEKDKYKQVILVANTDVELAEQFGLEDTCQVDGLVTFQDLSKDSQERLLDTKNVLFQGERITLRELLHTEAAEDYTGFLNSVMLEELVRGKEIKVGVRPFDLEENSARFYINRRFGIQIVVTKNFRNILTEKNLCDVTEKMIVISDSAGMGKSTVMTKMAVTIKKTYPFLWVIKINLNDYTRALRDSIKMKKNKINAVELLNFLEATKITNEFEKLVFSIIGKVVLMLDGVDEISPDYTDLVLSLLNHCQEAPNFKKIFVATRPHVDLKLNEAIVFQMLPFTVWEQTDFLTEYWLHNLHLSHKNKEKCKQYATTLIKNIYLWTPLTYYWQNTFTNVPLQVRMLAEIFQENIKGQGTGEWEGCKEYLERGESDPKLPEKFNIAELYDAFIEKKREVYVDKGSSGGSVTATPALLNQFESCLACHRSLAVSTILPECQEAFKTKIPIDSDTEEYILKIGIVQKLEGRVHFIHRTFAEYFVAHSIVQELKLRNPDANFQRLLINRILRTHEFKIVRTFLDIILQRVYLPPNSFDQYRSLKYEKSNSNLIFQLVEEGHVAILRQILGRCANITHWQLRLPFRKRNTLNHLTVRVRKERLNIKRKDGVFPLHLARTLAMVNFLIEQGANINARNNTGNTIAHIAASRGALDIVARLVEHGLDINLKNKNNYTTLHLATFRKKWNMVKYLVEHGADVNAKGYQGITALHVAITRNELDIVGHTEQEPDINMKQSNDDTALHMATYGENWNVVKYLVEQGADVNVGDEEGLTALHVAVKLNQMGTVEYLLEHGADINKTDFENNTALHVAIYGESWDFKYLVEQTVNYGDDKGLTKFNFAAGSNKLRIVEYLLQHGADINMKNLKNVTALHLATFVNDWKVVKYLAEHGADLNIKDQLGYTALHHAVVLGALDIIACLVEHGADVNARDEKGFTTLHLAAKYNTIGIVEYLLEQGADINAKNRENKTVLHMATYGENWNVVKCLVEQHVDVNAVDEDGLTALQMATKLNRMDIVKYLLERGANNTGLHVAVYDDS